MTDEIIQYKNFCIKDLKYKSDEKLSQRVLELQEKFNKKFNREEQEKLAYSQKVDFVYNTTALEGNTYTYSETETLLSGVTVGGHTIKESNEIVNQKEAWEFTLEKAFSEPKIEINENLIKDIHLRVGRDTVVRAGDYRDGRVKIGGTKYLPPKTNDQIKEWMNNFFGDFSSLKEEPYIKAVMLHFFVALLQPFYDGNKRTARLLMNFVLLQNDYPLLSIPVKIRKKYIDAMINGYENLDIDDLVKLLGELLVNRLEEIV